MEKLLNVERGKFREYCAYDPIMYNAISLFIISASQLFPSVSSRSLHALLKKCNITTYYFILNEREIVFNVNVFFFNECKFYNRSNDDQSRQKENCRII